MDKSEINHLMKSNQELIESLLRSTGREGIEQVIEWLEGHNFFKAAASVNKHNIFRGGLANHSIQVYKKTMELNEDDLPEDSIIICALLHDVCKHDQFYVDHHGKTWRNWKNIKKGHGRRSLDILKSLGLPLSYDEEMAIWWHMGQFERSKDEYPQEYDEAKKIPLARLINKADGIAAREADSHSASS